MANSFDSPSDTAEIHMYEGADGHVVHPDGRREPNPDGRYTRVLSMSWGGAE